MLLVPGQWTFLPTSSSSWAMILHLEFVDRSCLETRWTTQVHLKPRMSKLIISPFPSKKKKKSYLLCIFGRQQVQICKISILLIGSIVSWPSIYLVMPCHLSCHALFIVILNVCVQINFYLVIHGFKKSDFDWILKLKSAYYDLISQLSC